MKLVGAICLGIAVSCWFQYNGIQMSWAGKRPLGPKPETGETFAFQNHGVMYVSHADLYLLNYFISPALIFGGIGIVFVLLGITIRGSIIKNGKIEPIKIAGTILQAGFILFIPFWIFANPFIALANKSNDAHVLFSINIAVGAAIGVLGLVMQRGMIFPLRQDADDRK